MSYIPGYTSLSSVRRCTYTRPAPSRQSTEENRCSSRRRRTSRRVAWPITRSCASTTSRSSSPGSISSTFLSPRGDTSRTRRKRKAAAVSGLLSSNGPRPGPVWRGMNARPRPDSRDDAQLVRAAKAGDRGAFAAIYDRYADRLHDFCWGLLRDRDEAADATQDAFLVAAERLGQLRDPERLRPWLYAVARSQALRRARARQRVAPEEEMIDRPDTAAGPERATEQADLRELVWSAAAGLSERDRALLDLHLRQGLEGAELGEAMGIPAGHAYVLLSRLRDQVERSLGALLVARLGRRDCPDLAKLLTGWDGRFS